MTIDHKALQAQFRPTLIRTLLIGESPPSHRRTYFYQPAGMRLNMSADQDSSLPATIFCHYFGDRPSTNDVYSRYLHALKDAGIYLIDILEEPTLVRGSLEGLSRVRSEIPLLSKRLTDEGISTPEQDWIFLLPRRDYSTLIKQHYPDAQRVYWADFRRSRGSSLLSIHDQE